MSIRRLCVLAAFVAVISIGNTNVVRSQTKPNIVVIMIDDFDVESLRMLIANGMMPNLKRYFLDVGYDFVESFSTASLGAPSRATFLTGQYPQNHGVLGDYIPLGGITRLNATSTVATWLRTAGYRTAIAGRYLTGYGWWTDPSVIPPGWDDWQVLIDPGTFNTQQYSMNLNGRIVDFGALAASLGVELYQTDMVTYAASQALQRAAADPRPFFMYVTPVSFNFEVPAYNECPDPADQGPWKGNFLGVTQRPAARHANTIFGDAVDFPLPGAASFNEADVSDKPDWVIANAPFSPDDTDCLLKRHWRKLETMRAVDQLVGFVMSQLETKGLLGNTVAIFTGDNGFMDGEHRFPQKTPAYEESIRVPLFVRTPWNTVPTTIDRLVLNTDLAPTLARLAQATPTNVVDGRSLVPLLQNPGATWRTIGLFSHVVESPNRSTRFTGPPDYFALRTARPTPRKYVQYPAVTTGVNREYYDLTVDPHELQNQYLDPARQAQVQQLETWVNALKTCRGLGCYLLENSFKLAQ